MMTKYIENGIAVYVIVGIGAIGILLQSWISIFYSMAIKEANNMNAPKKGLLKQIKLKYESCFRLKVGVNNSTAFVERYLLRGKICGLAIGRCENIGILMGLLATAFGLGCSVYCYIEGIPMNMVVIYVASGIFVLISLVIFGFILNIWGKRELLVATITDYLDNTLFNRLASETVATKEELVRVEKSVAMLERDIDVESSEENVLKEHNIHKQSVRHGRKGMHKKEKDAKNIIVSNKDDADEKIISDIIKEFFT